MAKFKVGDKLVWNYGTKTKYDAEVIAITLRGQVESQVAIKYSTNGGAEFVATVDEKQLSVPVVTHYKNVYKDGSSDYYFAELASAKNLAAKKSVAFRIAGDWTNSLGYHNIRQTF